MTDKKSEPKTIHLDDIAGAIITTEAGLRYRVTEGDGGALVIGAVGDGELLTYWRGKKIVISQGSLFLTGKARC
jgi:hypothetical protein